MLWPLLSTVACNTQFSTVPLSALQHCVQIGLPPKRKQWSRDIEGEIGKLTKIWGESPVPTPKSGSRL